MTVPGNLISTLNRALGPVGDPLFASVSLLINSESGFVDSTGKHTVSAFNNATIVTGTSKFGTKSVYLDGNSDYVKVLNSTHFDFGTGDFCIECWAMPTAFNTYTRLFSKGLLNVGTTLDMEFNSADMAKPRMPSSTWATVTGCGFTTNTWHHVVMNRQSGTSRFFIDGVLKHATTAMNGSASNVEALYIGVHQSSLNQGTSFAGYIDEFRVTKGAARYTANFAVPTQSFLAY